MNEQLRQEILKRMAAARSGNARALLSPGGDALLIDGGPGNAFYLRPDGTVLQEHDEWGDEIRVVTDPRMRALAIRAGSARWRDLAGLLPPRMADMPPCQFCEGTGWDPYYPIVCRTCWGKGWAGAA
jgi:hypothetical protein